MKNFSSCKSHCVIRRQEVGETMTSAKSRKVNVLSGEYLSIILYLKTLGLDYTQKSWEKNPPINAKSSNIVYNRCVIRRQDVEGGRGGRVIRFIRGMTTFASGRCLVGFLVIIIIILIIFVIIVLILPLLLLIIISVIRVIRGMTTFALGRCLVVLLLLLIIIIVIIFVHHHAYPHHHHHQLCN